VKGCVGNENGGCEENSNRKNDGALVDDGRNSGATAWRGSIPEVGSELLYGSETESNEHAQLVWCRKIIELRLA
jgi:hypothetical protein